MNRKRLVSLIISISLILCALNFSAVSAAPNATIEYDPIICTHSNGLTRRTCTHVITLTGTARSNQTVRYKITNACFQACRTSIDYTLEVDVTAPTGTPVYSYTRSGSVGVNLSVNEDIGSIKNAMHNFWFSFTFNGAEYPNAQVGAIDLSLYKP